VSIETVATHFGMDPHTVRNWIKNGTHPKDPTRNRRLPAIRFGRRWRVRPADVRAFEAAMMAAEAGG
jgi:transposase-like protein